MVHTSKKLRVLVFAPAFVPHEASANLNNAKLVLAMMDAGWDVDVISSRDEGFSYHTEWSDPWMPLKSLTHEVGHEQGHGTERLTRRLAQSVTMGHPIRGVRWAHDAYIKAISLHSTKPYDVVLSRFLSEFAHLPAIKFSAITGVPWVASWNDPPAQYFPKPYHYGIKFPEKQILARYYREAASKARVNVLPSALLAEHMTGSVFSNADRNRIKIIPHMGLTGFQPEPYKRGDVFKLCHAGNLSAERNPLPFFKAFRKFIESGKPSPKAHIEIIGVEDVSIHNAINSLDLMDNISFAGGMRYADSLKRTSESNVLVIIEAPCDIGIFLPGKLADYVQTDRPILSLSPISGTIPDLFKEHGGGICADCESVDRIEIALHRLYEAWQNNHLAELVSQPLKELLSPRSVINAYGTVFDELTGKQ